MDRTYPYKRPRALTIIVNRLVIHLDFHVKATLYDSR
jgi:hypothetical protein